jgi:hypothetical protein
MNIYGDAATEDMREAQNKMWDLRCKPYERHGKQQGRIPNLVKNWPLR